MSKSYIVALLFALVVLKPVYAQEYSDSTYNEQAKREVRKFIKDNREENICELYIDDTLRLKIVASIFDLNNWRLRRAFDRTFYASGHLRSSGYYLCLWSRELNFEVPVNKHRYYRRNGSVKKISTFSNYGMPINDSLFTRRGKLEKVCVYTHLEDYDEDNSF